MPTPLQTTKKVTSFFTSFPDFISGIEISQGLPAFPSCKWRHVNEE